MITVFTIVVGETITMLFQKLEKYWSFEMKTALNIRVNGTILSTTKVSVIYKRLVHFLAKVQIYTVLLLLMAKPNLLNCITVYNFFIEFKTL